MSADPTEPVRPAIVGIAAIAACTTAVTVLAFAPDANLAVVLGLSAFAGGAIASIVHWGVVRPLVTEIGTARTQLSGARARLAEAIGRRDLLEGIDAELATAASEDQVVELIAHALATLLPDRENAVLLAPPTGGRVTWMIGVGPDGLDEPFILDQPMACEALAAGATWEVLSSSAPGVCRHVAAEEIEVSSLCVPIHVGEHHLGVAHSLGAPGDEVDPEALRLLETVTNRCGQRISEIRARRRHDWTLPLDPVTELPSDALAHREIRECLAERETFAVAVCDLDRFADYNAIHGPEAGDEALRAYAEALGATLRPTDVVCRGENDRFVCVFRDCTATNAASAMERVREALVLTNSIDGRPPFGVSVGVVGSDEAATVEELVVRAIEAVAAAKVAGGNRVVLTGTLDSIV